MRMFIGTIALCLLTQDTFAMDQTQPRKRRTHGSVWNREGAQKSKVAETKELTEANRLIAQMIQLQYISSDDLDEVKRKDKRPINLRKRLATQLKFKSLEYSPEKAAIWILETNIQNGREVDLCKKKLELVKSNQRIKDYGKDGRKRSVERAGQKPKRKKRSVGFSESNTTKEIQTDYLDPKTNKRVKIRSEAAKAVLTKKRKSRFRCI